MQTLGTKFNNQQERVFCSKVLLFGEYSVILNSKAYALPYPLFDGRLEFAYGQERQSLAEMQELRSFSRYIRSLMKEDRLPFEFDVDALDFDLEQGMIFQSSIPQGLGMGSSAAVCAAIFHRYGKAPEDLDNILTIRDHLAILESHFHGKSSGLDPLVSYLNRPLLVESFQHIRPMSIPDMIGEERDQGGAIFLFNSSKRRHTGPLVQLFLEKCKQEFFLNLCDDVLIPTTNQCISFFLNSQYELLLESFSLLSQFQREHFSPMIPTPTDVLWDEGLKSKKFFLKLCGAGGGGFFLGMTADWKELKRTLPAWQIRPLFFF